MREVHAYGCGPFRAYYHPRFSRAISNNKQKNERFTPFFCLYQICFMKGSINSFRGIFVFCVSLFLYQCERNMDRRIIRIYGHEER